MTKINSTGDSSSGEGLITLGGIGLGVAAAGVWYATHKLLSKLCTPLISKGDGRSISVEALYDKAIKAVSEKHKASISLEYEERCVLNPLDYKEDPETQETIDAYRDLMCGKIVDKMLTHIPSEYIHENLNPDYLRYLKIQRSLGVENEWLDSEIRRVRSTEQVAKILNSAREELLKRGVKDLYIDDVVTLERCSLFDTEDWTKLVQALEDFDSEGFSPLAIKLYLNLEPYAYSMGHMSVLDMLLKYGNNIPVFVQLLDSLSKGFTSEDIKECILKVVEDDLSWEVAYEQTKQEKVKEVEANNLRKFYNSKIGDQGEKT